jgi:hypothetical protein
MRLVYPRTQLVDSALNPQYLRVPFGAGESLVVYKLAHWISTTIILKGTIGTTGEHFVAGGAEEILIGRTLHHCGARVLMHVTESKCVVAHLCEHAAFVACVAISIVVVHENADAGAGWRLQVDVPGCVWREDLGENEFGIHFHQIRALEVERDDVIEYVM